MTNLLVIACRCNEVLKTWSLVIIVWKLLNSDDGLWWGFVDMCDYWTDVSSVCWHRRLTPQPWTNVSSSQRRFSNNSSLSLSSLSLPDILHSDLPSPSLWAPQEHVFSDIINYLIFCYYSLSVSRKDCELDCGVRPLNSFSPFFCSRFFGRVWNHGMICKNSWS